MNQYVNILVELDEESGVALITVNRADKLNALNHALLEELDAALDELAGSGLLRALIVTGAGDKAFVAGADIAEIASLDGRKAAVEFARFGQRVFSKLERLPVPVIMAINGYALGGGCELAMCGDIRLASNSAQLGQPEINLGVIPGYGGTQRLARLIGRDRAKGLIFTGERVGPRMRCASASWTAWYPPPRLSMKLRPWPRHWRARPRAPSPLRRWL